MTPFIRMQPSLSRDFALFSVFILFVLLLASGWVTAETFGNYRREMHKRMESEALRLDRALIVEVENASYILESVGRQIQTTGPEKQDLIAQLFFSFAKTTGVQHGIFSWVDREQRITVASNVGVLKEAIEVSDRDYVKKSIAEPWKVHIGRPILGRLSQKWVLPMSLGLTDASGTYVGTVVIALDTDKLTDDVSRTLKDADVRFAITNLALTVLTQNAASTGFFNSTFDPAVLQAIDFEKVPAGELVRGSLLKGPMQYAYYERSSQYPYIIFLGPDAAKARAELRGALMQRLLLLVLVAIFLLFVLYLVRSRIIHPVMALTAQTARIARGEGFDAAAVPGPLEIEQLATEIRRVYDYLEERRRVEAELRQKNSELNRIKEAAQLTNQVKADFFNYVGQELTEPVEVILEQIETIKDQHFGPLGNPLYGVHAREVHEHASQLLAMLADIKTIAEAETGLLALNETEVDIGFILQKTVRIFREKPPITAEVQLDVSAQLPRLMGDELRLKQMVLHILNASARQLSVGETIRITSSMRAQELSLMFTYTGAAQGGQAPIVQRSKHGLDMAMARLLVAMHQGVLELKTLPGRTTVVTVRFPAIRVV